MSNKDDVIYNILKKLVRHQYDYEQEALEIGGKTIKTEKELAKIYKKIIDREVDENEDRENSLT